MQKFPAAPARGRSGAQGTRRWFQVGQKVQRVQHEQPLDQPARHPAGLERKGSWYGDHRQPGRGNAEADRKETYLIWRFCVSGDLSYREHQRIPACHCHRGGHEVLWQCHRNQCAQVNVIAIYTTNITIITVPTIITITNIIIGIVFSDPGSFQWRKPATWCWWCPISTLFTTAAWSCHQR